MRFNPSLVTFSYLVCIILAIKASSEDDLASDEIVKSKGDEKGGLLSLDERVTKPTIIGEDNSIVELETEIDYFSVLAKFKNFKGEVLEKNVCLLTTDALKFLLKGKWIALAVKCEPICTFSPEEVAHLRQSELTDVNLKSAVWNCIRDNYLKDYEAFKKLHEYLVYMQAKIDKSESSKDKSKDPDTERDESETNSKNNDGIERDEL